jgi:hypothetical protein
MLGARGQKTPGRPICSQDVTGGIECQCTPVLPYPRQHVDSELALRVVVRRSKDPARATFAVITWKVDYPEFEGSVAGHAPGDELALRSKAWKLATCSKFLPATPMTRPGPNWLLIIALSVDASVVAVPALPGKQKA